MRKIISLIILAVIGTEALWAYRETTMSDGSKVISSDDGKCREKRWFENVKETDEKGKETIRKVEWVAYYYDINQRFGKNALTLVPGKQYSLQDPAVSSAYVGICTAFGGVPIGRSVAYYPRKSTTDDGRIKGGLCGFDRYGVVYGNAAEMCTNIDYDAAGNVLSSRTVEQGLALWSGVKCPAAGRTTDSGQLTMDVECDYSEASIISKIEFGFAGSTTKPDTDLKKEVSVSLLNSAKSECGGINADELKKIKNMMIGTAVASGVGAAGNIVATGFNIAQSDSKGGVNAATAGIGAAAGSASAVMSGISAAKLDKIIENFEKCQNAVKAL